MNNAEKYRFSDFTLANYQSLLKLALEQGYVFSDYDLSPVPDARKIIWRHDVEFSVHIARKMAQIESDLGIVAHYFVQIHSEFYNTFEREILDLILGIKSLGHKIGLHFDAHFWGVDSKDMLESCLNKDKIILEELLDLRVTSFSFHNTTPQLLAMNDLYYAGLLNVYAKEIRDTFRYCADSTGFWRYERLEEVLQDNTITNLQVLTHDGMWQEAAMAPRQRVFKCIDGRADRVKSLYDTSLPILGQLNIDNE